MEISANLGISAFQLERTGKLTLMMLKKNEEIFCTRSYPEASRTFRELRQWKSNFQEVFSNMTTSGHVHWQVILTGSRLRKSPGRRSCETLRSMLGTVASGCFRSQKLSSLGRAKIMSLQTSREDSTKSVQR